MPLHLPLSALRAFEAAARTGSFRAAASDLGLTPSAVSHAVRGLEDLLGAVLFLREGRSIRLTPDGETLVHHVERAFGELRLGIGAVSARGPQLLRLHSAPTFAANWLAPRLRRMLGECAGLEVRISAGVDYTRFIADEFDADIVYGLPPAEFYGGPSAARGGRPAARDRGRHAPLRAGAGRRDPFAARPAAPFLDRERQQAGALARLVRGQRPARARSARPALRPQLPVAERRGRRARRRAWNRCSSRSANSPRAAWCGRWRGCCEDITYTGHWLVFPRAKHNLRPLIAFRRWIAAELGLATELAPSDALHA